MSEARVEAARRVPIEIIIQARRIPLKKAGSELIGACPLCGGKDRFAVNLKKQIFNCRGCGGKGDVIELIRFLDGVDFPAALDTLTGPAPAPRKKPGGNGKAQDEGASVLSGEWNYEDEACEFLFQVRRFNRFQADGSPLLDDDGKQKKHFRQRHRDPNQPGKWINNIDGVRRVLYRLPQLLEDLAQDREIIIVEGERKVDLLRSWNIPATCNPMGAEKWRDEYSAVFRGARVCILPDNDGPGRKHIDKVAASLVRVGATVRVLDLPGLAPKGDVIDWAEAGGTGEQLHELIEREAKAWEKRRGEPFEARAGNGLDDAPLPAGAIKLIPGQLPRIVNETEAALIAANCGLHKREGQIVRIAEIEAIAADERKTTSLAIIEQSEHTLREDASAATTYLRWSKQEEQWLCVDPPMTVIKVLQGRLTRLLFPPVMGIISAPIILPNGRVIDTPGYDARTGLYYDPLGTSFPAIPEKPTQEDALEALNLLGDLLEEFPFTNDASKAVALSGLMTAVLRRALDFAFMHAITAPMFGSGKSYLVDLFCTLASGRCAPVISQGKTPEEFEKRLDSAILKSFGVLAIDNVNGLLEGDKLAQILSQPAIEIRLFGTQRNLTVAPASLVTATGINLHVVEDLRRRTLLCSLDAKEERPELRTFKTDPIRMVNAERGRYVAAALTIVRAFMAAGSPRVADPVNGYARYCAMIRDPLLWLGCADPCDTMEEIRKQDSRLASMHQVAAQWLATLGDHEHTAAEIVDHANARRHSFDDDRLVYPDFRAALAEVVRGKSLDAKSLGYWLRSVAGQIITLGASRYSFQSIRDTSTNRTLWRLRKADAEAAEKASPENRH